MILPTASAGRRLLRECKAFLAALLFLPCWLPSYAQTSGDSAQKSIQDNSFLVEEAYNQEHGVVQHISNFMHSWSGKEWSYAFTQEWPVDPSPRHQLSYTLTAAHADGASGLGDTALNYRYQLVGNTQSKLAVAPRFSLLLPSGDSKKGLGAGGAGLQFSFPASIVLDRHFVTHLNVGATVHPAAKDSAGDKATTSGFNLGHSIIWLAHPRLNFLLETVWSTQTQVIAPDKTRRNHDLLLNPGLRWAFNLKYFVAIPEYFFNI